MEKWLSLFDMTDTFCLLISRSGNQKTKLRETIAPEETITMSKEMDKERADIERERI